MLPLERMECINSIVTGYGTDLISGENYDESNSIAYNYRFINSLLRTKKIEDDENIINVIWEDINVVYSYDSDIMDGGRFVCDTVSFPGGTSAKYLRILVKRGVDYERGYSPKINEVEITAEDSEGAGDGDEESSETVTGSEVSSESGLGQESGTVSEETSQITVPQMPAGGTADSAGQTRGWMDFIPWITVACISLAVTAASVAVIIVERRKDPRGGETEIEDEKTK